MVNSTTRINSDDKKVTTIGTFNLRGLKGKTEAEGRLLKDQLAADLNRFQVDVCSLQETRTATTEKLEYKVGKYVICCLPAKDSSHGLGFAVHEKWESQISSYHAISERIAVLRLRLTKSRGSFLSIINVHAPTDRKCDEDEENKETERFYEQLQTAYSKHRSDTLVYIAGDFNAQVGIKQNDNETCLGKFPYYQRPRRSPNGKALISFMLANELFALNTAFQHPESLKWTWLSPSEKAWNQIDYVLCRGKDKFIAADARVRAQTHKKSDHRLLIAKIRLPLLNAAWGKAAKPKLQRATFDRRPIVMNCEAGGARHIYKTKAAEGLSRINYENGDIESVLQSVYTVLTKAAEDAAPAKRERNSRGRYEDSILFHLSERQMQLRERHRRAVMAGKHDQAVAIKAERNEIQHEIRWHVADLDRQKLEELALRVEKSRKDPAMLHKAVKALVKGHTKAEVYVNDENGDMVRSAKEKVIRVKDYFADQFNNTGIKDQAGNPQLPEPLPEPEPRPLDKPITATEVEQASKSLNNGRAVGPDELPAELLRYGPDILHRVLAGILNRGFKEAKMRNLGIGQGILIVIQKLGKDKGPLKSLRPISLLNSLRKLLSLITLNRIRDPVESYVDPSQCAYKRNRSTQDSIWTHRWLAACAVRYKTPIHILGLDMSRAFDTISRSKLLKILETEVNLDKDALRMVSALLCDTCLCVRIEGEKSEWFHTTIGTPQGDCLSPVLFIASVSRGSTTGTKSETRSQARG